MKKRIAFFLRRLADRFDPEVVWWGGAPQVSMSELVEAIEPHETPFLKRPGGFGE